MKNGIAISLLAAGLIGTAPANAAGPYDGVYQYGLSPAYYSVHQNGNTLLVVSLGQIANTGSVSISAGPYNITPGTIGDWDYALGGINGNAARISGLDLYGTCRTTTDVTFENGTATATFVSAVNTPFGTAQGINCQQLLGSAAASVGGTITLRKIF
jgi:hypothetical protein